MKCRVVLAVFSGFYPTTLDGPGTRADGIPPADVEKVKRRNLLWIRQNPQRPMLALLGVVEFKHLLPLQILQPDELNRSQVQVPSFGYSGHHILTNIACSWMIISKIQPVNLFQ